MKPITLILLSLLFLTNCNRDANTFCTISGRVTNSDAKELYLTLCDQKDTVSISEDGTFSFVAACTQPSDAVLQEKGLNLKIYLEPGRNLEVTINGQDDEKSVQFSGDLSLPARYL